MLQNVASAESSMSNADESHRKCADLELKLLSFRSQTCELEEKFRKSQENMEQRIREISELRQKIDAFHTTDPECTVPNQSPRSEIGERRYLLVVELVRHGRREVGCRTHR
jgi:uncharacterized coiled-coil DUF342 family protein